MTTPTREQLETVCDAAADAYYWADRARRTRLGEVPVHVFGTLAADSPLHAADDDRPGARAQTQRHRPAHRRGVPRGLSRRNEARVAKDSGDVMTRPLL